MPMLLRGLELPDPDIRANIIDTLLATTDGNQFTKPVIIEHAASLVATMLKNSSVKNTPSVVCFCFFL